MDKAVVIEKLKRKYTRKNKPQVQKKSESKKESKSLNIKLAALMAKLSDIMMRTGEPMRARAYNKAEETILAMDTDITTADDLKGKPGIGDTILKKIKEYLDSGKLELIEREENKPEVILTNVYGIGPQKAKELVNLNITNIKDLREQQDKVLNEVQKKGLKYYEDILKRIPRTEIDAYNKVFEKSFKKIADNDAHFEIVGSYRRGLPSSGDIDVIITSCYPIIFEKMLDSLIEQKIIVEVLSRGKHKCLVVSKIPSSDTYRRVDFLFSTPPEYPFSILYFTGSKGFNTVMRGRALKQGYSLNEHGLSYIDKNNKKEELVPNIFPDEKSIFDFLKMQYKSPTERIDGRSVVSIDETVEQDEKVQEEIVEDKEEVKDIPSKKTMKKREPATKKRKPKNIETQDIIHKMSGSDIEQKITEFKKNGISVLEKMDEATLSAMLKKANDIYYNENKVLLTDNEYDIIKEFVAAKYPTNQVLEEIGAPIQGKNKVNLPYEMASMDKIKPDSGALKGWTAKYTGPYVLSCKLDGVSGMYVCDSAGKYKLYTRGNGTVGQDVSHLINVLKLPKMKKDMAVRGEFIIPKEIFKSKYEKEFANARNLVSGIINRKSTDEKTKDLHFVVYEVVEPPMKPSEQMKNLSDNHFETVLHRVENSLTNEMLSDILSDWRKNHKYEIDGIIVSNNAVYPRAHGNPDHAFAFKMVMSDQVAEAKVLDVIWEASKDGYLKPRVRIEPIQLTGVRIEYATGFNGKFIEDNKIGIGAIIVMVRSGDVIPYIKSITVPAVVPKMPSVPYIWNKTHVDILLENPDEDVIVQEKNVAMFFVSLEVDGLAKGNIKKLFQAGKTSVAAILKMSVADFEKVDGFKRKMAEKIHGSIQEKIQKASLLDIMVASGKMGRGLGERKIKPILDKYPDILTSDKTPKEKEDMLKQVDGIGSETAHEFVKNIPDFLEFLHTCSLEHKLISIRENIKYEDSQIEGSQISNPMFGKKIVMTKIRDKEIIDYMTKNGIIMEDSMKKDVFILIVKSKDDKSNKITFAEKNGIKIMTADEFKAEYMK
jgi:NAD-dependent DNA ligase/DNA polymerase/3'-5' exonuclease PolX